MERKLSKKTVYVLGNPLLEKDSLPTKILSQLKNKFPDIEFKELDPTEGLPNEDHLILIDTIINIKDLIILKNPNPDQFQKPNAYSVHDYDLSFAIKLAKKMNSIKELTIIGIPPFIDANQAMRKIKAAIDKINKIKPN